MSCLQPLSQIARRSLAADNLSPAADRNLPTRSHLISTGCQEDLITARINPSGDEERKEK